MPRSALGHKRDFRAKHQPSMTSSWKLPAGAETKSAGMASSLLAQDLRRLAKVFA